MRFPFLQPFFNLFRPGGTIAETRPPDDIPNHGPCAICGKNVIHAYPWFTSNPDRPGAQPLHDHCWSTYDADGPPET